LSSSLLEKCDGGNAPLATINAWIGIHINVAYLY
jgi:hypothetical protein